MRFDDKVISRGYAIVEGVMDDGAVSKYIDLLGDEKLGESRRGGRRNLLAIPEMRELADSEMLMSLVRPVLGDGAFAVRGIFFDKQEGANWKVPWHQDVTIAVKERVENPGYGPWSRKEGVIHVQPPETVLEHMVSVRLHLDDCPASNGALRVVPGSHQRGRLDQNEIPRLMGDDIGVVCEVRRGGALLMKPLTIHASSVAEKPRHRRVIHFDYANKELDGNLQWFEK